MPNTSTSISTLQLSMILITFIGIQNHVLIIPALLESGGRDSWVSALVTGAISLVVVGLVYFVMKRTEQANIAYWINKRIGKIPGIFFVFLICLVLLIQVYIAVKDTTNWTKSSYLVNTPEIVIELSILLLGLLAALAGIEAIAITNGILLPFVILFGHLVMTGNFPRKDYTYLFPLFQNGYEPLWHGMLYAAASLVEIVGILFLQHYLKKPIRFLPLFITQLILITLMLSPLTGAIAAFGPETAQKLRYPAFEQWRILILVAGYIDQVDFLSIYQWLVGTFIRVSVGMYLFVEFLNLTGKKRKWALLGLVVVLLLLVQIPKSDVDFWFLLYYVLLPGNFVILSVIFLFLFVFALWKGKKQEKRGM